MRYLPLTARDREAMCQKIGIQSPDELFSDVPQTARLSHPLKTLDHHRPEFEVENHLRALAQKNISTYDLPSFLGAGAYRHHVPAAVDQLLLRGEFLTSYTPYQPEVSQGTLQALFEFQTQVASLTGMDVANGSMYDGPTAAAEAALMALRITKRSEVLIAGNVHPHYAEVISTFMRLTHHSAHVLPPNLDPHEDLSEHLSQSLACVIVQTPDVFGRLHDFSQLAKDCQKMSVLLIVVVTEIVSLGLLKSPGAMGADIVVAEGQSLGNSLSFGGPYVGLFACKETYLRQMPGRLVGETTDQDGSRGFVLTLSAREQHIRREKATSNICTNSGLCALAFSIHLSLLGATGLRHLALLNHERAGLLAEYLRKVPGCQVRSGPFFNEFVLELPIPAQLLVSRLVARSVLAGVPLERLYPDHPPFRNLLLVAATELTTPNDIATYAAALTEELS